jgi:hypothetical protein
MNGSDLGSNNLDSAISPRVAALEVGVRTIGTEVDSLKISFDRLGSQVTNGFAEIRRDLSVSGRPNWGWIIAALAVVISVIGAIGAAWVSPLKATDSIIFERLDRIEKLAESNRERSIRDQERIRVYEEIGMLGKVSVQK